jgi:hypothetical protein
MQKEKKENYKPKVYEKSHVICLAGTPDQVVFGGS